MESKMYGFLWENERFHVSLGASDLADSQKSHLKLNAIWRARCIDFPKKWWVSGVFGCEWFGGLAEMTLKVDLSMESRMCGFPQENNTFHVSLGASDLADSQKWHLKLTSVWRAKCMDFLEKTIGFMCLMILIDWYWYWYWYWLILIFDVFDWYWLILIVIDWWIVWLIKENEEEEGGEEEGRDAFKTRAHTSESGWKKQHEP